MGNAGHSVADGACRPASRKRALTGTERPPGTREKGTPDEPDLPEPVTETEKPEDDKPSKASAARVETSDETSEPLAKSGKSANAVT